MNTETCRPKIRIPLTQIDMMLETACALGVLITIGMAVYCYLHFPSRFPTHFGISGKPDAWGSSRMLVFIAPVLSAFMYALLSFVSRFPHACNYPVNVTADNAPRLYRLALSLLRWIKLETIALFLLGQWMLMDAVLGEEHVFAPWPMLLLTIVIIITTIIYTAKMAREKQ